MQKPPWAKSRFPCILRILLLKPQHPQHNFYGPLAWAAHSICYRYEINIDKTHSAGYNIMALARVLEWQTSTFEVRVVSPCGFESHLSHHNTYPYLIQQYQQGQVFLCPFLPQNRVISLTLQRISFSVALGLRFSPVSGLPKCNILCFRFVKIPQFVILLGISLYYQIQTFTEVFGIIIS